MKSFYQILLIWLNIYYRISNYSSGPFIYFIINDLAFLCHLNYYWAKTKKWHFSYDFFKVPTMIPNPLDDMWINVSVLMHYEIIIFFLYGIWINEEIFSSNFYHNFAYKNSTHLLPWRWIKWILFEIIFFKTLDKWETQNYPKVSFFVEYTKTH